MDKNNTIQVTKIIRQNQLTEKIVIVDGQAGSGKTMLSPIISSMKRVELLSYAFEVEWICRLFHLNKIEEDAAIALIKMLVDQKLYQTMMGRDTNFRYTDLSSAFQDSNPLRYFKRIFGEGDIVIPERIRNQKPILNLTTHALLSRIDPIISALGSSVLFIEVVRHPLYMVKQQQLNMDRLLDNPRDISINIEYEGSQLPFYAQGWEEQFINCNSMEKAIYSIEKETKDNNIKRQVLEKNKDFSMLTIPFEKFVLDPWPFLKKIETKLGTSVGPRTARMMKKQKVPRKIIADGPAFKIYERCGWEAPSEDSEENEVIKRRNMVAKNVSKEALEVMDKLSKDYFSKYLS
jgi:hypothetical protein